MKAIRCNNYGPPDVLTCEEVPTPLPGPGEVLLRVGAAAVNPLDRVLLAGSPLIRLFMTGWRRPRDPRMGRDVAGVVEKVGANVTRFKPGDAVFGGCLGAFAEFACAKEGSLAQKPSSLTFEEAAALPVAGLTALQALRDKANVLAGQRVLVNGAAGGVGILALQIAKALGAQVTGVCSAGAAPLVRSIGADAVVDYSREDFAGGAARYDVIVDCVGNRKLGALRRALEPGGTCVLVGGPPSVAAALIRAAWGTVASPLWRRRFTMFVARVRAADLEALRDLAEGGKVRTVIAGRYALEETAAAIRRLMEGHVHGKLVIVPGEDS